ncbi:MAG: methyltransferase domain-containing protein [Chloroflexi bacterium]|nr:methyltransferase domain-containing protein [Chloroflexota bacterium]
MNLIQRIHGQGQGPAHTHDESETHSHGVPFWVRHYDMIVNLITFGRTKTIHRETLSLAGLRPGDTVLDIGCGTGALLLEAENTVGPEGTAIGLDVEPAMVEQARRRAGKSHSRATFGVASIDQIPYPDDTFDVVFSTLMYHHLTESQKGAAFSELSRVLRPNGRLIMVDINPARRNILTSLPGHSQVEREDYVRSEVTERMQIAGFTVVEEGAHPSKQLSYAIGQKV